MIQYCELARLKIEVFQLILTIFLNEFHVVPIAAKANAEHQVPDDEVFFVAQVDQLLKINHT